MGYFDLKRLSDGSYTKPGMRGYPGLDPMQELLLEVVRDMDLVGVKTVYDSSARGGALALALRQRGLQVFPSDYSAATSLAIRQTLGEWGPLPSPSDMTNLIFDAERGNARVRREVSVLFSGTKVGGFALITGDKNRGFERYFKEARELFGGGEILERSRGLRVARLEKNNDSEVTWDQHGGLFTVQARGLTLECLAHHGVFSSGKLDPASALLLKHLPNGSGHKVLDIGSGYGVLGGFLRLEGAIVFMLEDDFPSFLASYKALHGGGLAFHSDVDSALSPNEKFDLIVTNPPFHVGSDLILDVALEFIRCAERRLTPGGEFWLVANHFLPYEPEMARIGVVHEVARERGFKVLMVKKPG